MSFIDEVYKTDLIDTEYLPYLESLIPRDANLADYIDTADFRLLRAIFSYYVRQERFCEGLWFDAVLDRVFSKILNRLAQILEQDTL